MIVIGVMVGSGIFIVPAEMARNIGSAGWLLVAWAFTGVLTIAAALSYGELASMMPRAGGVYVYLRQAFSPLTGFLYGWTLFTVIQTGTIAAVAVAFARFLGVLWPAISEANYVIAPIRGGRKLCCFAIDSADCCRTCHCGAHMDEQYGRPVREDWFRTYLRSQRSVRWRADIPRADSRAEYRSRSRKLRRSLDTSSSLANFGNT